MDIEKIGAITALIVNFILLASMIYVIQHFIIKFW